ncbi:unnamed protein product [Mytilus coruscus]|uniref:Uncharacterized protein n=1 Tax=Mytilus coruscus TaxID=42192 RepID=A0A6J8C9B9_MYTCO|nr:unnamed protein product [Mytilus coruscus]
MQMSDVNIDDFFQEFDQNNNVSSRFVDVNHREIEELIIGVEIKNTTKSTKWAFSTFEEWRINKNAKSSGHVIPELQYFEVDDINNNLGRFVIELFGLRRQDEHCNLQVEQIVLGEDYNGEYIEFKGKNCSGGLRHRSIASKAIKNYVGNAVRNIANYYRKYLDAIAKSGPFY